MKKLFVLLAVILSTHVFAAAIPVVPNAVVEEQVTSATEKVYSFAIKQGEGIAVNLAPNLNSGYIAYYLYDNEQLKVGAYLQNGSVSNSGATLDFKAASTGTYYLQVKSSGNGSYKLGFYNAWFNSGTTDADRPFHGSAYSAWELKNGIYSSNAANKYWYRFTATAGTKILLDVTTYLNSGSFSATIYDGVPDTYGHWTSLANMSFCCYSTNGITKTLAFTPATSGNFYLAVGQDSGGTITLNATGISLGTYQPPTSTTTPTACPIAGQQVTTSYAAGILKIPEVQVSDGLGGTLKYAVDLEIVPLSDPVIFKIKAATQKK